jgi:type IV secretion system protein VirB6
MPASIFTPAYDYVDDRLTAVLNTGLGNIIAAVEGPLRLALVLYIVLYGYAIFRGSISEPVMDGVVRLVKLIFIYAAATTVAYNTYVTEPLFNDLPNWLAEAISGAASPSVGAAFDSFFNRGGYLATKIWDSATLTNPGPYVTGFGVWAVTALTSAVGFGIVMLAKVALAVLVALGPIFVACLVFEASRSFFFGWLRQGVNYLLLFALIITIFQIILTLVADQWGNIDGQADPNQSGLLFIALCALGVIFFLQTPNIAAGIAGGAAAGIGDFYNAGRSGAKFSAAVGMGAAKLGYRGMKAAGSHMGGAQGGSVRPTPTTSRNGHPRR